MSVGSIQRSMSSPRLISETSASTTTRLWFRKVTLRPDLLDQLREPEYAKALTVEHPATSSPGLVMLATVRDYGEEGWLEFWRDLREGGVRVVPDWDTAYYNDFTRYGGESPMVVSYASSPPAEVIFATEPIDEAPTGVVEAGCYRQVEYAGILAGTEYPQFSRRPDRFHVVGRIPRDDSLTWFVFPANRNADLPRVRRHHDVPETPGASPRRQSPKTATGGSTNGSQ